MLGRKISHYEIVDKIGAGGMGVVYRAKDTLLQRFVAIKGLPPTTTEDSERERRFIVEACAASALNHPNIITIHDVVKDDGADFIVMEYVEGEPLDKCIPKGGMELKLALSYGIQIADALTAAHEANIAHRDLKPANVMVKPGGVVKILDFGLAKFCAPGEVGDEDVTMEVALTQVGTVLGTLEYMAPEQILGQAVDGRADIFSFGCLFYEMLTGRRPFTRKNPATLLHDIAYSDPELPRTLRQELPQAVEDIVMGALRKRPDDRYQDASHIKQELEAVRQDLASGKTPTTTLTKRDENLQSIAVLPLVNLSGDPAHEYFADGMTEALIGDLAKIRGLKVTTRTSVMQYKGVVKSLSDIARELGVGVVLEGSFARSGSRVRISVQLIKSSTEEHLWVETYDRELEDVLGIQSEVAKAIAREVKVKLSPQEAQHFARERKVDPEAHEAYLKGRFNWNQRNLVALRTGINFFNQAIAIDPTYAQAYVGLADSYNLLGYYNDRPPKEAYPLAIAAAKKALEIDPNLGEAHASLGYAECFYNWDWPAAQARFESSMELNPKYASTHQWHGWLLIARGELGRAISAMRQAQELDPLSLIINDHLGLTLSLAGMHNQAIAQLKKTLELSPAYPLAYQRLGSVHLRQGAVDEAIEHFKKAIELSAGRLGKAHLGLALAASGEVSAAREILERLLELRETRFISALELAFVYDGLGQIEEAFQSLDQAIDDRVSDLIRLEHHPWSRLLRADPRFAALLASIGLPKASVAEKTAS